MAPNPEIERLPRSKSPSLALSLLTAAVVCIILLLHPEKLLSDGDTLWRIVVGQKILQNHTLPVKDEFSYLFSGATYRTNSWLGDVLLAAAFKFHGFSGVVLLTTLSVALTFFILQREYLRQLPANVGIYFCIATFVLLVPHILGRPHVLAFPLIALWSIGLLRAQEKDIAPSLWTLPIFGLWANMHSSFLLGFVIIFPFCLLSSFRDGLLHSQKLRSWLIYIAGMILATMAGPYGIHLATTAINIVGFGKLIYHVSEWRPQDFSHFDTFEMVMLSATGALIYLGVKLNAASMLILLGLLHMSLAHVRYTDYLAIIGSLVLVTPISQKLDRREFVINTKYLLPVALMIALIQSSILIYLNSVIPDNTAYPIAAIRAARNNGAHGRVLNSYDFGGALIFEGEKVFIDGRMELYPESFLQEYFSNKHGSDVSALDEFLKVQQIDWTLLNRDQAIASSMNKIPGWRVVYQDDAVIAHIRTARDF